MTIDLDRLCDNRTPMDARAVPLRAKDGRERVVVIAKLTWAVSPDGRARLAPVQRPIRFGHERWAHRRWSSLRYPSDLSDEKPGTDVMLVGNALPPPDSKATQMDVTLRIESGKRTIAKAVRVFGSRVFMQGALGIAPGPAARLGPTPLTYELAHGGVDEEKLYQPGAVDPENPAGRGHRLDRKSLIGSPAPAIELVDGSGPAGFGAIDTGWEPRLSRFGTCDAEWQRRRAPLAPSDFDPRFNSFAHPDLWSPEPLTGSEPIEIVGATPEPAFRFKLPHVAACFSHTADGEIRRLATHLDSLIIDLVDPTLRVVELVWRASLCAPRKLQKLAPVVVTFDPPLSDDLARETVRSIACHDPGTQGGSP